MVAAILHKVLFFLEVPYDGIQRFVRRNTDVLRRNVHPVSPDLGHGFIVDLVHQHTGSQHRVSAALVVFLPALHGRVGRQHIGTVRTPLIQAFGIRIRAGRDSRFMVCRGRCHVQTVFHAVFPDLESAAALHHQLFDGFVLPGMVWVCHHRIHLCKVADDAGNVVPLRPQGGSLEVADKLVDTVIGIIDLVQSCADHHSLAVRVVQRHRGAVLQVYCYMAVLVFPDLELTDDVRQAVAVLQPRAANHIPDCLFNVIDLGGIAGDYFFGSGCPAAQSLVIAGLLLNPLVMLPQCFAVHVYLRGQHFQRVVIFPQVLEILSGSLAVVLGVAAVPLVLVPAAAAVAHRVRIQALPVVQSQGVILRSLKVKLQRGNHDLCAFQSVDVVEPVAQTDLRVCSVQVVHVYQPN